jgi:hypothetical protein
MSVFIHIGGDWWWRNRKSRLNENPYWIQDLTVDANKYFQHYHVFRDGDFDHCLSMVVTKFEDITTYETALKPVGGGNIIITDSVISHESFDAMMAYARLWGRRKEHRYNEETTNVE